MFFSFLTNLLKVCVGILRFWFDPDNSAKVITLREISRDLWNYVYIGRALNTVINNVKVEILFRPKLFFYCSSFNPQFSYISFLTISC